MQIKEAERVEIQTDTERKLQAKITALLNDDGHGHHYQKFAARLADFVVKIVDRRQHPEIVAAIQWETNTILISSGFITKDPDVFNQLSVLLRHELAHNLMCHEVRMMHKITEKYGEKRWTRLSMSNSLRSILNIIEDFEISNERYTAEDKATVLNMHICGEIISGLITENHRADWEKLSLEQMYDELEKEIDNIQNRIRASFDALDLNTYTFKNSPDYIIHELTNKLNSYTDINHPTNFFGSLEKFIQNKAYYHFTPYDEGNRICLVAYESLPEIYQEIVKAISDEFTEANGYIKQDLKDIIKEIGKSNPIEPFDIKGKSGKVVYDLYTPEERFIAIDALKARIPELEAYNTWYDKVKKTLADPKYSDADLQKIFDEINK